MRAIGTEQELSGKGSIDMLQIVLPDDDITRRELFDLNSKIACESGFDHDVDEGQAYMLASLVVNRGCDNQAMHPSREVGRFRQWTIIRRDRVIATVIGGSQVCPPSGFSDTIPTTRNNVPRSQERARVCRSIFQRRIWRGGMDVWWT